jgi:hypothetical protein
MNYQNAKIYKIVDNTSDAIYIGSTCKTLQQRLKGHEADYKKFKNGNYHFITSFKILENNDYKIELVKLFPCGSKQELNLEEGKMIKQFRNDNKNIVNRNIAGQTVKESKAQYRQNNRGLINEKQNQKHNCCCGGSFFNRNKLAHEATKKHQNYINNSKTLVNNGTLNINITVNNPKDLEKILKTINK